MSKYHFPPGYSFFKTYERAVKLVNNPIESMLESIDRFGDTYTVYSGLSRRIILTQEPEFIDYVLKRNHRNYNKSEMNSVKLGRFLGNGLLTSNGSYWLQQRRLIQPGFHIQKIQALYEIMKKTTDHFLEKFPTGKSVDVYPLMNRMAFEIVINTLFDIEIPEASIKELINFINVTQDFVIKDIRQPHKSWWFRLSGEVRKNLVHSAKAREVIRGIIRQRRESTEKFNDLLDMLLEARYEDTGEPMREDQLIDEIMVLIIAGHETTGNALAWTLYLLATHPEELEKLRAATNSLNLNECVRNENLMAVINESMRLYPPAWISDRVAIEDDAFKDYAFPKNTIVILFFFGLHRSQQYWQNPLSFKPDRFLKDSAKEINKIYYPFGGGPRLCIGNNFAMAEMAIFLQSFIRQFDIQSANVVPEMNPLITLRPDRVMLSVSRLN